MKKYFLFLFIILNFIHFDSALAVTVKSVTGDEEKTVLARLGTLKSDKNKVVLHVQINGAGYSTYSSGLLKDGSRMDALYVDSYKSDTLLQQEYSKRLMDHGFPVHAVDFYLVLDDETPAESLIGRLVGAQREVQKKFDIVQDQEKHGLFNDTTILREYASSKKELFQAITKYFDSRRQVEVENWKNAVQALHSDKLTQKTKDTLQKIDTLDQSVLQCANTPPLVDIDKSGIANLMEIFCKRWGSHAEDAFIHKLLRDIENDNFEPGHPPRKITIFGSKDPCTQCQLKLQWLADMLAQKFGTVIEICYYSENAYDCLCMLSNVPTVHHTSTYTTRTLAQMDQVKSFTFSSSRQVDENQAECFNVVTVDLSKTDFSFEDIKTICLTTCTYIKLEFVNFDSKKTDEMDGKVSQVIAAVKASLSQNATKIQVGVFISDAKSNVLRSYEVVA